MREGLIVTNKGPIGTNRWPSVEVLIGTDNDSAVGAIISRTIDKGP